MLVTIGVQKPDFLQKPEYLNPAKAGGWDLIIYDRCKPAEMPRANTFFFGSIPPVGWTSQGQVVMPEIFDINRTHQIAQNVDFHNVVIAGAEPLLPPKERLVYSIVRVDFWERLLRVKGSKILCWGSGSLLK